MIHSLLSLGLGMLMIVAGALQLWFPVQAIRFSQRAVGKFFCDKLPQVFFSVTLARVMALWVMLFGVALLLLSLRSLL
jgi:hypothetical protein